METVPEIGKYYHFWDDGKSSPSRHYVCKCERVITPDEAKNIMVNVPYDDDLTIETTLYDHWLESEMPDMPKRQIISLSVHAQNMMRITFGS